MAAVAAMVLRCPGCASVLHGNGWDQRIAKVRSRVAEPEPVRVPVHRLVCPACRDAGRHPWNFTVLPSLLSPRKHFRQSTRMSVFDAGLGHGHGPRAIERDSGVDRGLVRLWLVAALVVVSTALPALVAEVLRYGGDLPVVGAADGPWTRWWAAGLALRLAVGRMAPEVVAPPASVLEWLTVVGARGRCRWAP